MKAITYKDFLMNSSSAYLWMKGIKNESGIYIDFEIKETNESFRRYVHYKNMDNKKISELIPNKAEETIQEIVSMIDEYKEKSEHSHIVFNESIKKYLGFQLYYIGEETFVVKVTESRSYDMSILNILKESPFALWMKDTDGNYIAANKLCAMIMGKSCEEIIGIRDIDIVDEKRAIERIKQDKEVMETKRVQSFQDIMYIEETNEKLVCEVTKWPYIDIEGNVLGTIGIAIDVVDDVSLRENIEENEKNFEAIVNFAEEVFIIYDRNKTLYTSRSYKNMFGEEPNELHKEYKNWHQHYHIDDVNNLDVTFDEPMDFVIRGNPKTQLGRWFWVKCVPIKDERGNAIKNIKVIRDITERKKLDLELESLRMDFFANISHELRTPINVIYGTLQLFKKIADKEDYSYLNNVSRYLNIIDQNCMRLLKLVNNLIDTTKIDAGYLEYKPQNYNIVSFIENISTSVAEFIQLSKLNLIFDTNEEEAIVAFDLDMMERIILNLLSNAIKYNKENGYINIDINCNEENINIAVEDSGIGIDEYNLKTIFGRFEQVSNKNVPYREGSGIGLSLVKSLVELHKGSIKAESELGKGTKFIISIPRTVLPESEVVSDIDINYDGRVNRMQVEFSDIYV